MANQSVTPRWTFVSLLDGNAPQAVAWVRGNTEAPDLSGIVKFYQTPYQGVLIEAEIFQLPDAASPDSTNFYGMHIHENGDCSDQFSHVGDHYNPTNRPHPRHAGDLLPLFGNQGYAWMAFYDKRFSIRELLGRAVIIHSKSDDFTSQPSGNSGAMIGCGVIRAVNHG